MHDTVLSIKPTVRIEMRKIKYNLLYSSTMRCGVSSCKDIKRKWLILNMYRGQNTAFITFFFNKENLTNYLKFWFTVHQTQHVKSDAS